MGSDYIPSRGALEGQRFATKREYLNALARKQGFASWSAKQRAPRRVGPKTFDSLSAAEVDQRAAAFEALPLMRSGVSLERAARAGGTTPANVIKWAGSALVRGKGGRWVAKPTDRLYRRMMILTLQGLAEVNVYSSRQAGEVARYMNAVGRFLRTGEEAGLKRFEGKSIAGVALITDPDLLQRIGMEHPVRFESIYATNR